MNEYGLVHVADLRVSAVLSTDPFGWSAGMRFWGLGGGLVAFDYGAKTFRVGAGIDEAEAKRIVDALRARMPVAHDRRDPAMQPTGSARG